MNKGIKALIITGSILVGVGLTIAIVGFATNGFKFTGFVAKYNDRAEEFTEDFNNIKVDEKISNISLVYYGGEKCKVEFHEIEYETHTCEIKDGVLTVTTEDTRNWRTFKFGTNSAKTTIYLPKTTYINAELKTNTGDITLNSDLSFNSVKANTNTGDITWKANVNESIEFGTNTGDIRVSDITAKSITASGDTGNMTIKNTNLSGKFKFDNNTGNIVVDNCQIGSIEGNTTTGDMSFKRTTLTGDLNAHCSTGDVKFVSFDASNIDVATSTGDITGSLKTGKIFTANTSTGKVSVPTSSGSGYAKFKTSTGKINITIE